jgi:Clp amino terminal domain, pathogenicity island component
VRLLPRRPHLRAARPGERYLAAGADEARRLGHRYGTRPARPYAESPQRHNQGPPPAWRYARRHQAVRSADRTVGPRIDPEALATLGIDLETVRERVEETFGHGALERTGAGMLEPTSFGIKCIAPRLKQALADALDRAGEAPVRDEHVLLGMLSVPDSLAARALAELGVSIDAAEARVPGSADASD